MKFPKTLSFIFILFILVDCNKIENKDYLFGLVLTVDDGYIDQWYEYLDYLDQYNAKLTFYITNYLALTSEQKIKLTEIANRGHEIGFHGTIHVSVTEYLQDHSITDYMNDVIFKGLDAMKSDSFSIKHFAYPYGISNNEVDILLQNYFISLRKLAWTNEDTKLKDLTSIYYKLPCTSRIIKGAGIDITYNVPLEDIKEAIDSIAFNKEAMILYCHKLTDDPGKWNIRIDKLKGIIQYCFDNEVPFITVDDLYSVNDD